MRDGGRGVTVKQKCDDYGFFITVFLSSHLPFVRQTGLELFACVLRVLDVDELLVDCRRIVKGGLSASIYAGD